MVAIHILASAVILFLVILPRFNRWPGNESERFSGKPSEYISRGKYFLYSSIYLSTFVLFAFALSQLENAEAISASITQTIPSQFTDILGNSSFTAFLIMLTALLAVPRINEVDERWRSTLFSLARLPRDALELKVRLSASLWKINLDGQRMQAIIDRFTGDSDGIFWQTVVDGQGDQQTSPLGKALLKSLYLAAINHLLHPTTPDIEDLTRIEKRLAELATILPRVSTDTSRTQLHEYQMELDNLTDDLTEILAKNAVRHYPDGNRRHSMLLQYGLVIEYLDHKEPDYQPFILAIAGMLAACVVVITLGLLAFDEAGVSPPGRPGAASWFELERITGWSLGGWTSYVIAALFGIFFNEVISRKLGPGNWIAYLLAFLFGTLGAGIFFTLARENFSPPFVWLSISFGLFSAVTIASCNRHYETSREVIVKAVQISIAYGLITGLLQLLTHLSFRGMETTGINVAAFLLFGFFRGFAVAFLLSYLFLEHERHRVVEPQRKNPRLRFRRKIEGVIGGSKTALYIRDLSEKGTLAKVPSEAAIREGDDVRLQFGFTDLRGRILSVKNHLARIRFNDEDQNLHQLRTYIHERLKEA
ncbi:PilZ domain-containing protein [Allohahella marinimesophila]|uniref:PilZ domain-containing protein n=1 Tax=Allohahella marinimesophila TaxID=1054972 RepID=A0ABP7NWG8_9GAMM